MKPLRLGGVLLLAAGATACRKPAPIDPEVEAYHSAVVRFAEVSKLTEDLTYRDPRFDPILDALDRIPVGSEPKPQAQALADRIRSARALANSEQPNSDRMQAEATAEPIFEPILKLPAANAARPASPIDEPASAAPLGTNEIPSGGPVQRVGRRHLPSWYAGYLGTPAAAEDDAGAVGPEEASAAAEREAADAKAEAAPPHPASSKRVDAGAPPQVFGLPGPAGSALQGLPGASE